MSLGEEPSEEVRYPEGYPEGVGEGCRPEEIGHNHVSGVSCYTAQERKRPYEPGGAGQ